MVNQMIVLSVTKKSCISSLIILCPPENKTLITNEGLYFKYPLLLFCHLILLFQVQTTYSVE